LTKAQQLALVDALLDQAGNLVEFLSEMAARGSVDAVLADADPNAVAAQLSVWLRRLPGDNWDSRLDGGIAATDYILPTRLFPHD